MGTTSFFLIPNREPDAAIILQKWEELLVDSIREKLLRLSHLLYLLTIPCTLIGGLVSALICYSHRTEILATLESYNLYLLVFGGGALLAIPVSLLNGLFGVVDSMSAFTPKYTATTTAKPDAAGDGEDSKRPKEGQVVGDVILAGSVLAGSLGLGCVLPVVYLIIAYVVEQTTLGKEAETMGFVFTVLGESEPGVAFFIIALCVTAAAMVGGQLSNEVVRIPAQILLNNRARRLHRQGMDMMLQEPPHFQPPSDSIKEISAAFANFEAFMEDYRTSVEKETKKKLDSLAFHYAGIACDQQVVQQGLVGKYPVVVAEALVTCQSHLKIAEANYTSNAYSEMWESCRRATIEIEKAYKKYKDYSAEYLNYSRQLTDHSQATNLPAVPFLTDYGNELGTAQNDLVVLVRRAATNPTCTMIWEQKKTQEILIAGFKSLTEAIASLSYTISSELRDIHQSVVRQEQSITEVVSIHRESNNHLRQVEDALRNSTTISLAQIEELKQTKQISRDIRTLGERQERDKKFK